MTDNILVKSRGRKIPCPVCGVKLATLRDADTRYETAILTPDNIGQYELENNCDRFGKAIGVDLSRKYRMMPVLKGFVRERLWLESSQSKAPVIRFLRDQRWQR